MTERKYKIVADESETKFKKEIKKLQKVGYVIHSIAKGVGGQFVALLHNPEMGRKISRLLGGKRNGR